MPLRGPLFDPLLAKNHSNARSSNPRREKRQARLSSKPGCKIGTLSEEYLEIRNQQMRTKNLTAEMQLAERRGELIQKTLVEKQAAFLLVSLFQRILQIPHTYARQLLGITDAKVMSDKLREMSVAILNDIKNLPQQVLIRIGLKRWKRKKLQLRMKPDALKGSNLVPNRIVLSMYRNQSSRFSAAM